MPSQQTAPHGVVRLVRLVRLVALRGLDSATRAQCQARRAEAGRLWTDLDGPGRLWTELVTLHAQARAQGRWLSAGELEQATKGGQYALQSQRVPALCQKLVANVDTATALRRQDLTESGRIQTQSPHHSKGDQTVVGKDQALAILPTGQLRLPTGQLRLPTGQLRLPTGGWRAPLLLPLAEEYQRANLRRVEVTWRADHSELCLRIVPDARHRGNAATAAGGWGSRWGGSGGGAHRRRDHDAAAGAGGVGTAVTRR